VTIGDDRSSSNHKPRRDPRFPVDTRVTVNQAGQTVSGQAVEVSQGGIAILTVADLTVGEVVELQFKLRRSVLRLRAIVRNRKGARYGMEFLTLSAEQREHIGNWCHSVTQHG
jgi:c-di-GMP-binding flagellar brake protein YcgR